MEEKKNIPYKIYNSKESPIITYYSHITNPNNEHYNLEMKKISSLNFQNIPQLQLSSNLSKNNQNFSLNEENPEKKNYKQKNNNFKLKSEIDIQRKKSENKIEEKLADYNKDEINNINKNNKNDILEIKKIKPEDLIPYEINGNIILRINPIIYRNESYEFLSSNLYILLKDQLGCKFLQEKLEKDPQNAVYYFFKSLIPNIIELIKDKFANYFIQKLFYYLNEEQYEYILRILSNDFFEICTDVHGTRVIQYLMDCLLTEKLKIIFFDIIKPIFVQLINEINGTHIIYKFLYNYWEFLKSSNDIIINNILSIGMNKRGCIFLQNYLSTLNNKMLKNKVIQILLNNCTNLITDQFGNYLVQYLLNMKDSQISLKIINQTINNITFYSKHKYANYVIEKMLINSNNMQKQKIIEKISSKDVINELLFDKQGNFIILKVLKFADSNTKNIILNMINNSKKKIEETSDGKKFLKKLQKFYEK